jgi:hypothetical protein
MQLPTFVAGSLLLALVPWGAGTQQQEGFRPRQLPRDAAEREALLTERLCGAWQLTAATYQNEEVGGLDRAGYLLAQPGYLSLELHLVMRSTWAVDSEQPFFQSGTYRWRFLGGTRLETSLLIGCTNISETERWDFEQPGQLRTYEMTLTETTLVLERGGESRLVFKKLPALPFPGPQQPGFDRKRPEGEGGAEKKGG